MARDDHHPDAARTPATHPPRGVAAPEPTGLTFAEYDDPRRWVVNISLDRHGHTRAWAAHLGLTEVPYAGEYSDGRTYVHTGWPLLAAWGWTVFVGSDEPAPRSAAATELAAEVVAAIEADAAVTA